MLGTGLGAGTERFGTGGAERGGAEPEGFELGGAASEGAESGGAEPQGASSSGGSAGTSPRLSPQQLREWFVRRARLRIGATRAGGAGAAGAGGTGAAARAGGPGGARTRGTGAARTSGVEGATVVGPRAGGAGATGAGVGGSGAAGTKVVDPGAGGAGGTVRPRLYFVPLLQQVLGTPTSTGLTPPLMCLPPDRSQPPLQPACPLPAPSPYTEQSGGLTEHCEPASRPVLPVRTARHVPRSRPPPVPGTHAMALILPLFHCVFLYLLLLIPLFLRPLTLSLTALVLLAPLSLVSSPLLSQTLRLNYATALVAVSASASPPSVGGECALGTNVLEDRQEDFECLPAAVPRFASLLLAPEGDPDAPDIPTPRSYTEAIMGFAICIPTAASQTLFSSLFLILSQFYVLVYVDDLVFATADTEALTLMKSELQKRHTCTDLGELRSYLGLQITQDRARRTITLTQSHMVHQVLQHFGFQFSSPQPTPLSTSHSLSAPPSDESVEPSGPYPELVGCLMYLMTCTPPDLAYPLSLLARYVTPGQHREVHWDAVKRVLRYLCSTCEAEIYARAMAAQELRWLTYLLTDLGEQPRAPPVLYVDNKAMIALCKEHRLEHKTKHIALRYFLARELQQRGQLRLAYVDGHSGQHC
ncbi:unnamed protein product [Closterium sp. NIES-54]